MAEYFELKEQLSNAKEAKNFSEVVRLSNALQGVQAPAADEMSAEYLKMQLREAYAVKDFSRVVRLDNALKERETSAQ